MYYPRVTAAIHHTMIGEPDRRTSENHVVYGHLLDRGFATETLYSIQRMLVPTI